MKRAALAITPVVLAVFGMTACGTATEESDTPAAAPAETVTVVETQPAPAETVTVVETKPAPAKPKPAKTPTVDESNETSGQRNAREAAKDYLTYQAFSRRGLIEQLKYEGYSKADAEYAVDAINVNWNEQAVKSAKSYLDYQSFSRSGLVEQLEYEGFTHSQAEYGVRKAY